MSKPGSDKRGEQIDRVVELTASRISAALDKMADDLPEDAAPQMALELVVRKLEELQPWIMGLIMDFVIREAHATAVAEKPSKPKARRAFSFSR